MRNHRVKVYRDEQTMAVPGRRSGRRIVIFVVRLDKDGLFALLRTPHIR